MGALCVPLIAAMATSAHAERRPLVTTVVLSVEPSRPQLDEAIRRSIDRAALERCWPFPGSLEARATFDDGKVTAVAFDREHDAKACVEKVVRRARLSKQPGRLVARLHVAAVDPDALGSTITSPPPDGSGRSTNEVHNAIRAHASEIRACQEKHRGKRPEGKVVMYIEADRRGTTTRAAVKSSTLRSPAVERCMVSVFRRIKFPPGEDRLSVSYPVVFSSAE